MDALDQKGFEAAKRAAAAETKDYYTIDAKIEAAIRAYLAATTRADIEAIRNLEPRHEGEGSEPS